MGRKPYYVHRGFKSQRARWCRLVYVRGRVFCALADVLSEFEGKWTAFGAEKPVVFSSNVFACIFGGLRL
jgi:hypothetical protein